MKYLAMLTVFICVSLSFGIDNDKKTDASGATKIINVRTSDTIISSWDSTRAIYADVGGIVKFKQRQYKGDTVTVVMTLNDAQMYAIRGLVKVYPTYNGTDSITTQYLDTNGVARRGVRIWR